MARANKASSGARSRAPRIAAIVSRDILPAWTAADDGPAGGAADGALMAPWRRAGSTASLRALAQFIDALAEAALSGRQPASAPRAAQLLVETLRRFLGADGGPGFPRAVDVNGLVIDATR